jgi:hypothetical protein
MTTSRFSPNARASLVWATRNEKCARCDLNVSVSSSVQVTPNFWTDTKNGIPYYFAVQTPESGSPRHFS